MVWVIEWSYPYDSESNVTAWASEKDAQKQACSEILDRIQNEWNLGDQEYATEAKAINDMVGNGEFKRAIRYWNDCSLNCDSDYAMYWRVRELDEQDYSGNVTLIDESLFTGLLDEEESEEEEDEEESSDEEEEYQASTPGATCRGPCAQHNEYAYANKRDGTHVCHSCRMMSQVFGGTIK